MRSRALPSWMRLTMMLDKKSAGPIRIKSAITLPATSRTSVYTAIINETRLITQPPMVSNTGTGSLRRAAIQRLTPLFTLAS